MHLFIVTDRCRENSADALIDVMLFKKHFKNKISTVKSILIIEKFHNIYEKIILNLWSKQTIKVLRNIVKIEFSTVLFKNK